MDKIKLIIVGESKVGKTSLINQYLEKKFDFDITFTITSDKFEKIIKLDNDKELKIEIWDTAGQEKYRVVNKIFIKNSKIALLVYDITNRNSFEQIDYWYKTIKDLNPFEVIFGVVANKIDLYKKQIISKEEGENYAKSINALFFETSSMEYDSINQVFIEIANAYFKNIAERESIINKGTEIEKIKKIKEENEIDDIISHDSVQLMKGDKKNSNCHC